MSAFCLGIRMHSEWVDEVTIGYDLSWLENLRSGSSEVRRVWRARFHQCIHQTVEDEDFVHKMYRIKPWSRSTSAVMVIDSSPSALLDGRRVDLRMTYGASSDLRDLSRLILNESWERLCIQA